MKKIDYYIPMYKGNLYHVYNRGNGKEMLFYQQKNYYYFLKQYEKYLYNLIDTFAYCLLKNHFHLLVRPKINEPDLISEQFRKFFISYSMSVNKQEKRRGSLLQRGFKRKNIDDENYFYSAVYYVHSNPVHHKIATDLTKYKYSSYRTLAGDGNTKLCRKEATEWFGGRRKFIDYHEEKKRTYFSDNYIIEDE